MKKVAITSCSVLAVLWVGVARATEVVISIDNRSGSDITAITAAPRTADAAAISLLQNGTIAPGQQSEVVWSSDGDLCLFDLRITFAGAAEMERADVDLCQTETLIIE